MSVCRNCGKGVTPDEMGLYKKLVNRGAQDYLCIRCLAQQMHTTDTVLREKMEQFRRMGCMLFPQTPSHIE